MKLSANLSQVLNLQMNVEYANFLLYEQMRILLDSVAWDGFKKFMKKSAHDEQKHAGKFRDYLIDRNAVPQLSSIPAPVVPPAPDRDSMPLTLFKAALAAEQANTNRILQLSALAEEEADYDLELWLKWALEEQRTSERELFDIINQLQSAEGENAALLLVEEKVGKD